MAIGYSLNPFSGNFDAVTQTGNGTIATANLYDPVDSTLPTSAPLVIDSVSVSTGMLVLFSNLGSGNNEVYKATISGSSVSWVAQTIFNGLATPSSGTLIVITQGTGFTNQTGEFTGTTWLFNNYVRYFNGTNYYEQSSLNTSTITDNTTNGTIFSLAYLGSENISVDYSIVRGTDKESGTIKLTTDGTNVALSDSFSTTGNTGVTFNGIISGSNLLLRYTTTSTGTSGTMNYFITRWSDTAGGPGGPPTYTVGIPPTVASGSNSNIQINGSGTLSSNTNFSYDTSNNLLKLGSEEKSILNTTSFLDNQVSPVAIITMPATYNAVYINYTIIRGTAVKVGRIMIATDGSIGIGDAEDYAESPSGGATGVLLFVSLSGGNIIVSYTSTSTGSGGTFKYTYSRW